MSEQNKDETLELILKTNAPSYIKSVELIELLKQQILEGQKGLDLLNLPVVITDLHRSKQKELEAGFEPVFKALESFAETLRMTFLKTIFERINCHMFSSPDLKTKREWKKNSAKHESQGG